MKYLYLPFFQAVSGDFRFAAPLYLLGLLAIPLLLALAIARERRRTGTLRFSSVALIRKAVRGIRPPWRTMLIVMRMLALSLLLVAMARPQFGRVERQTWSEGIDIVLALDVSLSMSNDDFFPNRLEAAKDVIKEFVGQRQGDRVGLVIFASDPLTLVPLTLDYGVVRSFIERVQFGIVDGNSTAVGMGLSTALKKLQTSSAKSKVVILLTDGENNAGKIDPSAAAEAAKAAKVRVYTIGVGTNAPRMTFLGPVGDAGFDEKSLQQIADTTGGQYFHATNNQKLQSIYEQIDRLEKSRVESTQFDNFRELIPHFVFPAIALIALELVLRSTRFVKVP